MVTISHSEVESFLLCPRKHFYGYALGVEHISASDAQTRGTMGHECMAVFYQDIKDGLSPKDAHAHLMDTLMHMMDGSNSTLVSELAGIFKLHLEAQPFKDYKILEVEKEYVLEMSPGVSYPFVVDMLVQDLRKRIFVVDHKFVYDFMLPKVMSVLPQIPKYIGALRALGIPAFGGLYHQLRYRKLKNPDVNSVIQRFQLPLTQQRVTRTFEEQIINTEKLLERRALPIEEQSYLATRVGNAMVCKSCSFNAICDAELSDNNPQLVLKTQYKSRERRLFTEAEETE